ncbi:MAG TPA: hypothetical protein VEF04_03980 [Blastocatellia bacterium]|nr:hypothetical protein [Blastocatellia bacterium]
MHEKLSTSFVRMDGLLEELRDERFSGYVALNFAQTSGLLFINQGEVVSALEISGHEHHAGLSIKEQLFRLAQQTKGAVSVYHLQDEIVMALAGIAEGETVYVNLTSDFAHLGKLIRKLSQEQRLYFISMVFTDRPEDGGLVYVDGDQTEASCSSGDASYVGSEALNRLIEESDKRLSVFSVYRQSSKGELPKFDEREVEVSLNKIAPKTMPEVTPAVSAPTLAQQPVASPSVEAPTPARSTTSVPPAASEQPSAIKAAPPQPQYETVMPSNIQAGAEIKAPSSPKPAPEPLGDDILEVVDLEAPPKNVAPSAPNGKTSPAQGGLSGLSAAHITPAPLPESRPVQSENEMRELTGLLSAVVAAVERGMTVAGRGSSFPTALRAGLLAVTERYPFLDPFAAEFEYHDHEIVFVGSAQPNEFVSGLTEALRQMVEDLIYSSNGRVRDYIAEELRKVEREREADMRRFNLGNLTEQICQH